MRKSILLLFWTIIVLPLNWPNNTFANEAGLICGSSFFPPQLKDGVYPRHYRPDRTVDFQHLNLEIKVDMNEMRIEGAAHYTFQPIHDGVQTIRFDAYELDIQDVDGPESPSMDWRYSDNALYVEFDSPLPMGENQTLSIQYASDKLKMGGRFQDGMHFTDSKHVAPQSADQMFTIGEPIGACSWLPCGDYPNDRLTTEIYVTAPKEFTTLSNGLLIDSQEEGEWRTDHWKQKIPHVTYLISLVVGRFSIVRDEWRGIPVEYYVEKGLEEHARPSMGKTPDMIEFFSNYLDYPYPYEKYAQVAVRYFTAGGMEHTTATTLHEWTVMDGNARQDSDQDGLIMHELAHQWFGDLITCESWDELWLNEGFATLSDALWDEYS
ncbi:MAG: M1 family metallopeptidase, partial [Candidatus Hinthialibacter sp.]